MFEIWLSQSKDQKHNRYFKFTEAVFNIFLLKMVQPKFRLIRIPLGGNWMRSCDVQQDAGTDLSSPKQLLVFLIKRIKQTTSLPPFRAIMKTLEKR